MKSFLFVKQGDGNYGMQDQGQLIYRGESRHSKGSQTLMLRNAYDDVIITITMPIGNAFSLFHARKGTEMSVQMGDQQGQLYWKEAQLHWQLPSSRYQMVIADHEPYADIIMSREQEVLGYSQGMSCWLKSTAYSAVFAVLWMMMQQRRSIRFLDESTYARYMKEAKR